MWQCAKCREDVEDTFQVCWNCGTSSDGVEDPNFHKEEETTPAETAVQTASGFTGKEDMTPGELAAEDKRTITCPACGSEFLEHGWMGGDTRFFRDSKWLQVGWNFKAFVCLDCGILTQYLSKADLESLREEKT
jgi:hypothetical protein